jgi:integrase
MSKSEAQALDTDIKARKLRSEVLPPSRSYRLSQAWEDWLASKSGKLEASTLGSYEALWDAHIKGTDFAATPIGALVSDPKLIDDHINSLRAKDPKNRQLPPEDQAPLGDASKRRLLMVLSGVFKECVRWKKISLNPIREMDKPSAKPKRRRRPFPPILVERIRRQLIDAGSDDELAAKGHAVLVSLLSYAGLRPQEALALRFEDIGSNTITIDKAIKIARNGAGGRASEATVVGPTKTGKDRSVPLAAPLASDLTEWRDALGDPPAGHPVIPSASGKTWTIPMYRKWRTVVWKPAVAALAASDPSLDFLANSRPYDCRGSFVSLHLRAAVPPIEIAADAGHSLDVLYRHYGSVIEELKGEAPVSADEQIAKARALIEEEAAETVAALTEESLKAPADMSSQASAILYGDFPRVHSSPPGD